MSPKKPKVEAIYCLFHKTYNCICIKPVTDEATLQMRIEHQKRLDELKKRLNIK